MIAEVTIGRRGRQSPINSMLALARESAASKKWSIIGIMGVLAGLMIMAFYSVVAGWALEYAKESFLGAFSQIDGETAKQNLSNLMNDPTRLITWHTVFTFLTFSVVAAGVTGGLEVVARIFMPFLFVALVVLLIYAFVRGDFSAGLNFLFDFKFELLTGESILIALGHAFFTLSLGMGAIMAYGAYMPAHANIGRTVVTIAILDTAVALGAGLAIFPIVFATPGLEPSSGPGLMFVSLPVAFGNMPFGVIFGSLFFILVVVAAWSSAVALIEPGVAWLVEKTPLGRVSATALLSVIAWLGGIACIYSNNWEGKNDGFWFAFEGLDFVTSQIMLPLGGLFISIFVGWIMNRKALEKELDGEDHPMFEIWLFVIRYISPILVTLVMIVSLYKTFSAH